MTIELPTLTCNRCGHTWIPRKPQLPKNCPNPKCNSPYWNKERVKNICRITGKACEIDNSECEYSNLYPKPWAEEYPDFCPLKQDDHDDLPI